MVAQPEAWRVWLSVVPPAWFVLAPSFFVLLVMMALKQSEAVRRYNMYLREKGEKPIPTGFYSGNDAIYKVFWAILPLDLDDKARRTVWWARLWTLLFFANLVGLFVTLIP